MANRDLYLYEVVDIVGQGQYDYMEHLWKDPVLRMPEMFGLQGSFYVCAAGGGRWPQVINIWDIGTLGWANEPMIDSYSILVQVLHSKTGTAGVFNWGGWGNAEIDRLTDEAATELDPTKRLPLQTKALEIAHDEVMFLPPPPA